MRDNAMERLSKFDEALSKEEVKKAKLDQCIANTKENFDAVADSLKDHQTLNVQELRGVVEGSRHQLEQFGTLDVAAVVDKIRQLELMIGKHAQYRILLQHTSGMIGSVQRFTRQFTDSLRKPLEDVTHASKANFVFKLLLEDRAIYPEPNQEVASGANLRLYLIREAKAMRVSEEDLEDVVDLVLAANIEAEDLCAACGTPEEDVASINKGTMDKLDAYILQSAGIRSKSITAKKLKDMHESQKTKQKELKRLQTQLSKTFDEGEVEELEAKQEAAEDECENLGQQIAEFEGSIKEKEEAMADKRASRLLVERALGQCLRTYTRHLEKRRGDEIDNLFGGFYTSVVENIKNFIEFAKQQEANHDARIRALANDGARASGYQNKMLRAGPSVGGATPAIAG